MILLGYSAVQESRQTQIASKNEFCFVPDFFVLLIIVISDKANIREGYHLVLSQIITFMICKTY